MTLTQVWGSLLIFVLCPVLGGLPLIEWITYALARKRLSRIGTKNVSVSAAFYHGGKVAGILAVVSEALKGILAVVLARSFFPNQPEWELIALIALVFGRYWIGKGAGTTNVTWGYIVHDPITAFLTFLIGGIGFTILRERQLGRFAVLMLFPLITAARHMDSALIGASICLAGLMGWIYTQMPDDLDLQPNTAQTDSQTMFKFFRGDRAILSLDQPLRADKVGEKAATLSRLKLLGYPVPMGWVLLPGDDPQPLIERLQPSEQDPLVVRSSAIGEDSELASAAGQYETVLGITQRSQLLPAITHCLASYDQPAAVNYRRDRGMSDTSMVVLIQQQVRGVFSGVAFSRDPIARQGDAVVIEALPGSADRVVSGQVTPESYQVLVSGALASDWRLPDEQTLEVQGRGNVPPRLIQQVAYLARHLEQHYHGIPQDIEWSYDGQTLWLLQSRPITTLLPIWTRKIAAEVIPGAIRPLTWSINRPLTCGVWGRLFALVLGVRSQGLDFNETATLHYSHAYFNATLLGQTFLRMGLPPESLEFLTRGAAFSKPPLFSTLKNIPGLLKLIGRELRLEKDFQQEAQHYFSPALTQFATYPTTELSPLDVLKRIDTILDLLKRATYYSILAPLSAALRASMFKVAEDEIDNSRTPEVAALRSLQDIATCARALDSATALNTETMDAAHLFQQLEQTPQGQQVLGKFEAFLEQYGYLSEVGTDIAVPTWREDPTPLRAVFAQFYLNPTERSQTPTPRSGQSVPRQKSRVQRRVDLKGRVTEVYSRLLAELRWSFVALEQHWLQSGVLERPGDIFFLTYDEVRHAIDAEPASIGSREIEHRRDRFEHDRHLAQVPQLVYGDDPPAPKLETWQASETLQGIGASPGQREGRIQILRSLSAAVRLDRDTILVVPYTDSGWAAILAQVGGLISEAGGRLSHGAIVAREYRIPAVMDIPNATSLLRDGQQVRIDGQRGTVEIL
ncbi:glycerol-3-phosphate acyltransferase [Myxacorys almedinensis]|uniref:Pyruvate phosphate dikinase PEP/pyruvate-binding protein n=1 Tax=Myxacorys almedinensis A TaxID=2690445 RepID=A0A8J8CK46_9CYAN|nr:glycerol-3-phosphate acyltransferase [Myxacorys almedinensis]NDJ18246.1 pyruvate phosphate dikinase PEP/pyruvate-binding protein [Myxacorys almedinensis A]